MDKLVWTYFSPLEVRGGPNTGLSPSSVSHLYEVFNPSLLVQGKPVYLHGSACEELF